MEEPAPAVGPEVGLSLKGESDNGRPALRRARSVDATTHSRDRIVRRSLVTSDVVALVIAYAVVEVVVGDTLGTAAGTQALAFAASIPLWILGAKVYGLYAGDARKVDHTTVDELVPILHLATVGTWLGTLVAWAAGWNWSISGIAAFWVVALVALPTGRAVARSIVHRRPAYTQNALIVGAGDVGQLVGRKLRQHPELGVRLVGFVDADPKPKRADLDGVPIVGAPDQIVALVHEYAVDRVVVAFSNESHSDLLTLVRSLRGLDVHIDVVPRLFEAVGPVVDFHAIEGMPLVELPAVKVSRAARLTKRALDVVVSAALLALLSPLLLMISWRVRRTSHGPALFRQTRLGEGMTEFTLLKFRTLDVDADVDVHRDYVNEIMDLRSAPTASNNLYKLDRPDDVTTTGSWLRRTSLDELPQLINVLRGEMSLVGPRPCIPYETEVFEPHHFDRFLVPAGMTGLWQVTARANATFKEALDLDALYARNWSFRLDLWLLARTPGVVLRGRESTS